MSNDQLSGAERAIDYLDLGFPILFHPEAGDNREIRGIRHAKRRRRHPVSLRHRQERRSPLEVHRPAPQRPPHQRTDHQAVGRAAVALKYLGLSSTVIPAKAGIQGYHVLQSPIDLRRTDALTLSHAWERGFHPSFRLCIRQATWISAFARMTKGELSVGHTIPLILSSDECRESR